MLYVSNGSNKSEELNLNDIEVLVDSGDQNWFKRAHIGQYLYHNIDCQVIRRRNKISGLPPG